MLNVLNKPLIYFLGHKHSNTDICITSLSNSYHERDFVLLFKFIGLICLSKMPKCNFHYDLKHQM